MMTQAFFSLVTRISNLQENSFNCRALNQLRRKARAQLNQIFDDLRLPQPAGG